jgi:hypothetical protein
VSKTEAPEQPRPSEGQGGRFDMAVVCTEPSPATTGRPEAAERWAHRAEILARWLVALWQKERQGDGRD